MIRPAYGLKVSEYGSKAEEPVAVIGKDIRSQPEHIARYCLDTHRPVNEDVATIAESLALADRMFSRHRSVTWSRLIDIQIPVFEIEIFQRPFVYDSLVDAVHFLTGDTWNIRFVRRRKPPISQNVLPFEKIRHKYVTPYSDGLDSFAQAILLEHENGPEEILKLRSARMGRDSDELQRPVLRVPRGFGSLPKKEQTYRTRPFVFFSFAGIGAVVAKAEAVVIGESGQGAFGPPLVPYADEWPFRSTHPGFLARMEIYLSNVLGEAVPFIMPQKWRTKGEVLRELKVRNLLGKWQETSSCSVRPVGKHGAGACGICGGCTLRALAVHSASLDATELKSAFNPRHWKAIGCDREPMSCSERHLAVRSLGTMVEFARIGTTMKGAAAIEAESKLISPSEPESAAANLRALAKRHADEWHAYLASLPRRSWVKTFAGHL